eukprot:TRINITY_DN2525_c0_g12_i1.p1 TRINITY_DN2525_c0_g12~~TRINITY_DN2525_c0_g12_i1.p1  ORF type:complete len:334 (+),score=88.10 TRINITY_DN2525_c0_g12_i1:49-1050(+)
MSQSIAKRDVTPWVEKYRPKTVDDVAHQEEVVGTLQKSIETGNLPHLLFYGPPGTGKTSTILALARQLYGPSLYKSRILELNASDERGIDVVRTKVKSFAQFSVSNEKTEGYPCPPFKIVILDEADAMTADAQAALRRTMETHSSITRFCIICNYISRIIDPLTSRCAKFRFKPLEKNVMTDRLRFICMQESVTVGESDLDLVVEVSGGDMRRAVTLLQTATRYGSILEIREKITEISGLIPGTIVDAIIQAVRSNRFSLIQQKVSQVIKEGFSVQQALLQIFDWVVESDLKEGQKAGIISKIATADKRLVDGADDSLQLLDVASFMAQTMAS